MARFILIHGAWHGAWCWYRVAPLLERLGHAVLTPDLPGHGVDPAPASQCTLAGYVAAVIAALDAPGEPAVLVGHSFGGIVISQAAEARPDRVRVLGYLAAFLPGNGEASADLAESDPANPLVRAVVRTPDGAALALRPDGLGAAFYHDCPAEEVALARRLLRPEPLGPLLQPVQVTDTRFGQVPRVYLECRDDRVIALARQRRMQAAHPCREVLALGTGHSPFFALPETLVQCLLKL